MRWISFFGMLVVSGVTGSAGPGDNFYNYRSEYDDDEYSSRSGYDSLQPKRRDYYEDEEESYRRNEDWTRSSNRGWGIPSSPSTVNRIPSRHQRPHQVHPEKGIGGGWDEEETPWTSPPPRRRKPSYVVKIRRPVKKDPAWIYFRPPNSGRVTPEHGNGWARPAPVQPSSPSRHPPSNKGGSSWEEETNTGGGFPKDASYSFAYDAGDSDRSEYADPWGTVHGSYSYVDPTGLRRTVHYTAGSATGFKVLNSQPSNVLENVFRDPVVVRRKPSAFVYHLHPDGGWKPWEGRKEGKKNHRGTFRSRPSLPPGDEQVEEELTLDETRYDLAPQQQNYQPHHHRKSLEESYQEAEPQSQRYEPSAQRFEPSAQRYEPSAQRYEPQQEQKESKDVEIRGYEGGYGEKNPLIVVDDKRISAGKLMAMRMRRRKSDQNESQKVTLKPQRKSGKISGDN